MGKITSKHQGNLQRSTSQHLALTNPATALTNVADKKKFPALIQVKVTHNYKTMVLITLLINKDKFILSIINPLFLFH